MCLCAVCVHIYTNTGSSFYFGKVKSVTLRLMGKCMGLEIVPECGGTPAQATVMAFPLFRWLLYQNLASVTEQSNSQDSSYNNDSSGVSSFPGEQRHTSNNGPTTPKPSATDIYSQRSWINQERQQKKEFSSRIIGVSLSFGLSCSHLAETLARITEMNVQTPKGRDRFFQFSMSMMKPLAWWMWWCDI